MTTSRWIMRDESSASLLRGGRGARWGAGRPWARAVRGRI